MRNERDAWNIIRICCERLHAIGIECGPVREVVINTRAKARWGCCIKKCNVETGRVYYRIEISSWLMSESVDIKQLENTAIHELLHTCDGCMDHGTKWKRLAEQVNRAYGYNIQQTTTYEEKGIVPEERPAPKHKFECVGCGSVVIRFRESKFTKHYDRYACAKCGRDFRKVF